MVILKELPNMRPYSQVQWSLDKSHIEIVREAALLHDVGKIGIPENILTKTGMLTSEEYDIV